MQFFKKTNINFVGKRHLFFIISLILMGLGVISTVLFPPTLSIDFTGGTEIAVDFHQNIHTDQVRDVIEKAGIKGAEIKSYGQENQFLIRIQQKTNAKEIIEKELTTNFPQHKVEILKVDTIGPKVGKELGLQAVLAVVLSVIAIMLYIAFRFEFMFGFGAVIALIHDVFFTFSVIVVVHNLGLIDIEISQSIVAALLTVLGYSINDTVIIFDRIRENREKYKGFDFIRMTNLSINETLSRTVNTVLTVFMVLLVITLIGGPVLQGFAFTMLVGILIGTYSSVYIASSYTIWYLQKVKKVELKDYNPNDSVVDGTAKA